VILALLVLLDQLEILVRKDQLVCKVIQAILVILVQLEIKVQLVCVEHLVKQGLTEQLDQLVQLDLAVDKLVSLDLPADNLTTVEIQELLIVRSQNM
jgi:hypothetical protein